MGGGEGVKLGRRGTAPGDILKRSISNRIFYPDDVNPKVGVVIPAYMPRF